MENSWLIHGNSCLKRRFYFDRNYHELTMNFHELLYKSFFLEEQNNKKHAKVLWRTQKSPIFAVRVIIDNV